MYPEEVLASKFANNSENARAAGENASHAGVDASLLRAVRTRMVESEAAMLAARLRNADRSAHSHKLAA